MYFPRDWEIGSALSKLRNFWGEGAGLSPPNHPLGTPLKQRYLFYKIITNKEATIF
jgi:hypothetical protein